MEFTDEEKRQLEIIEAYARFLDEKFDDIAEEYEKIIKLVGVIENKKINDFLKYLKNSITIFDYEKIEKYGYKKLKD